MNKRRHEARKARKVTWRARAKLMSPEHLITEATTCNRHNAAKRDAAIAEIAWRMTMARTKRGMMSTRKYKHQLFVAYRKAVRLHADYISGRAQYDKAHGYYRSNVEDWFNDNAVRERTENEMEMNSLSPF